MMSDVYYNSKKTDDICDDVCGKVSLPLSLQLVGSLVDHLPLLVFWIRCLVAEEPFVDF